MIELVINPAIAYLCIILAILFFRRDKITIGQALILPFRRAVLIDKPKFREVFTLPGIILLITGFIIAFLDVAMF